MNHLKILLLLFFAYSNAFAQSWEVNISGKLTSSKTTVVPSEILVTLCQNNDTVSVVNTNENGEFALVTTFEFGNTYTLQLTSNDRYQKTKKIRLFNKEDTAMVSEYRIEVEFPDIIHNKFDNSAYYALNETRKFQNFEIDILKELQNQFPEMCMEFVQTIHPNELQKIAKKRKTLFLKELEKSGFDMKRIHFRKDVLILTEAQLIEDDRSRIQGIIRSLEGDCGK